MRLKPSRKTQRDIALEILGGGDIRTISDLRQSGISINVMRRLVRDGLIVSPALGLYQAADAAPGQFDEWAMVAAREPEAVFVLLSAASYHGITQENPGSLQIGIPMERGQPPRMSGDFFTPIEALRWRSPTNLQVGVDEIKINGVSVKVTSQERTVVDLWRYSTLNRTLSSHNGGQRITAETFHDCLARYLDPDQGNANVSDLGRIADAFGLTQQLSGLVNQAVAGNRLGR